MHRRHQRDFPPIICGSFTELSERVNVCEKIANGLLIADTEAIIAHGASSWHPPPPILNENWFQSGMCIRDGT